MIAYMKRSRTGLPPANAVISPKTQAVLEIAEHDYQNQRAGWLEKWDAAVSAFSRKAVVRKFHELADRKYITAPCYGEMGCGEPEQFSLTDRGRAVLELCRFQATLRQSA